VISQPKVSVCLPNLNNRKWLPERVRSVTEQTLSDWELIIVDNHSEDGAWEFFLEVAKSDVRVQIAQAERRGMYANWNNCVQRASGDWVYIATSDDTMKHECLAKLVDAGEKFGADVVASEDWLIDSNGQEISAARARAEVRLLNLPRGKAAWLDSERSLLSGLIFGTPITSMTQLLIRRSLFERVGLFPNEYGSFGDFVWQMKALSASKWVFVPEKLGAWRVHEDQATPADPLRILEARAKMVGALVRAGAIPRRFRFNLGAALALRFGDDADRDGLGAVYRQIARFLGWAPNDVSRLLRRTLAMLN